MTIKQQGGIFGRNPTFNEINTDGDVSVGGDLTVATDVTVSSGNLVIANSGSGIDFSATSGTGTSELLSDYEEGTWTPSLGGTTTYTVQQGTYVKVGSLVQVKMTLLINTIGDGSGIDITGLPYANGDSIAHLGVAYMSNSATSVVLVNGSIEANGSGIRMRSLTAASTIYGTSNIFGNGTYIEMSGSYSTLT